MAIIILWPLWCLTVSIRTLSWIKPLTWVCQQPTIITIMNHQENLASLQIWWFILSALCWYSQKRAREMNYSVFSTSLFIFWTCAFLSPMSRLVMESSKNFLSFFFLAIHQYLGNINMFPFLYLYLHTTFCSPRYIV